MKAVQFVMLLISYNTSQTGIKKIKQYSLHYVYPSSNILCAIAKLQKETISFVSICLSVCRHLPVRIELGSYSMDFHEIRYEDYIEIYREN